MASSSVTYTSGTNNFNITFGYLRDTHVIVQVGSTQYDINDNYFTIDTTSTPKVVLNTPVSDGTTVKILRKSLGKNNDQGFLVDFVDGSVLTEKQQDEAYQHNYYINQESKEGNLSVGTPILDTDAANKAYVDQAVADGALNNLGGNVTVGGELTIGTDEFKIKGFSATDTELNDAVSAGVSGDSSFGGVITGDPAGHIVVAVNNNDPKDSFSVVTSITVVTTGTSSVSSGAGTITVEAITTALPIGTILYLGSTTLTLTSAASASDTTLTGTFSASIGSGQTLTTYNQNLYENRLKIYPTETVINECSSDHNFRVEGKTNENLLLADAGNDRVIIGGSAPADSAYDSSACTVTGNTSHTILFVENSSSTATDDATVTVKANGDATVHLFDATATADRGRYNVSSLNGNLEFGSIADTGSSNPAGLVLMRMSRNSAGTQSIINIANIPTSASGLSSGDIYSDSGTLKIV